MKGKMKGRERANLPLLFLVPPLHLPSHLHLLARLRTAFCTSHTTHCQTSPPAQAVPRHSFSLPSQLFRPAAQTQRVTHTTTFASTFQSGPIHCHRISPCLDIMSSLPSHRQQQPMQVEIPIIAAQASTSQQQQPPAPEAPPQRPLTPRQREKSAANLNTSQGSSSSQAAGPPSFGNAIEDPSPSKFTPDEALPTLQMQLGSGLLTVSVSSRPPLPRDKAQAVTLSPRSRPHPSALPDQAALARYAILLAQRERLGKRAQSEPNPSLRPARAATAIKQHPLHQQHQPKSNSATRTSRNGDVGELNGEQQGWNSPRSRAESAQGALTKPVEEISASGTQEAGTAATEQQQHSPQAATSVKPAKPAWSAPKSWADLASRSSNRTAPITTAGAGASATASNSSAVTSPVLPSTSASASPSIQNSMILPPTAPAADVTTGKKPNGNAAAVERLTLRRPPLEEALRAPPSFDAPLTLPRGLVNTGNLCFANSVRSIPQKKGLVTATLTDKLALHAWCRFCKCSSFAHRFTTFSPPLAANCRMISRIGRRC